MTATEPAQRTLYSYVTEYMTGRRKRGEIIPRTAKNQESALRSLEKSFGRRPLDQLTKRAIERWLETISHNAPESRRNMVGTVRAFCRWLLEEGVIDTDPCLKIPRIRRVRSVPRALPTSDVGALLRVLPDQRARVIVTLMVGCGLRCIEVSRLAMPDFDSSARTISVRGKGGHERVLPVPHFVYVELMRYLDEVGVQAGVPLIRSKMHPSRGISEATISGYVTEWFKAAGIKHGPWNGRSAHALRHTCASDVLDTGADLRTVQEMLGHAHLNSTAIYLRRAHIGQLREAMEGRDYSSTGGDEDVAS